MSVSRSLWLVHPVAFPRQVKNKDFGFGWNAMVHALRSRDHLSNEERDELLFVHLAAPAHRLFFGGEYVALPTMLTAPLFVELWLLCSMVC